MDKKGETKRQHYVPRMLLRNFSEDKKRVSLLVLSSGARVDSAAISTQCYEDYFYGADNILEKSFAAEEDKIAGHLGDLSAAHLEALSPDILYDLRQYVHYQRIRTLGAAEGLNERADAFAKALLRPMVENHPDLTPADLDKVRLTINNAPGQVIFHASKTVPLLLDLVVKFIITDRAPGFVFSDNPVVAYNQFAEHHPKFRHYRGITGLSAKGLQFFLPLSPNVVLAVYDPSTYSYGSPKSQICTPGPKDIRALNEMQAINAYECLYYLSNRTPQPYLDELLAARRKHPSVCTGRVTQGPMTPRGDGTHRQLMVINGVDLKVGQKLSFIQVTDRSTYYHYDRAILPIRSERLMRLMELYGDWIDEKVERERKKRVTEIR